MYTLLKDVAIKKIVSGEVPSLGLSFAVAEIFYKFGSFILESGAFLVTWYLVSFFLHTFFNIIKAKKTSTADIDAVKPN